MLRREHKTITSRLFGALFALIFAFSAFFALSAPALATQVNLDPDLDAATQQTQATQQSQQQSSNQEGTTNATNATDTSAEDNVCLDQTGAVSWLICPNTTGIAKAIDGIYTIIENFLVVSPITSDSSSTIHIVWEYMRNITNIVFIILLLIVIWSQVTGIGLSNYNIKRTLPRLILAVILVNLSFIICQLAVDASNIIGSSLKDFFASVETSAISDGANAGLGTSWAEVAGLMTGGGIAAGLGIGSVGLAASFWALLPIILGALVSVAIGLVTIAMRQAVITLLVMISPLAFVAYLLPNTETWFTKWKTLFFQMLIFYPTFALLFGASQLAGWAILSSSDNLFGTILGLAVQVYPLFACWSLMKMSGTVLGRINTRMYGLASRPLSSVSRASAERAAIARAEHTARQLKQPFNPLSLGSWRARLVQDEHDRADRLAAANSEISNITTTSLNARKRGTRVIGYDKNGMPIYSSYHKATREMRREANLRASNLNTTVSNLETNNAFGALSSHLGSHHIKDEELQNIVGAQGQNYLNLRTAQNAAALNARSDQRYYFEKVREASLRDPHTGKLVNPELYNQLIKAGAGGDAYVDPSLSGEALARAQEHAQSATISVISNAYDALEADRRVTTAKYTTYLSKQVTKEVLATYDDMLRKKDIDGIVAAQNTLAFRGDYDKINENLRRYLDQDGYLELGTDFASTLAGNLLAMKGAAPHLARIGKHINVETWHYTDWNPESGEEQRSKFVTLKEFYTGLDSKGIKTKYYAPNLMQGTPLKDIDRTFWAGITDDMKHYYTAENFGSDTAAHDAKMALISSMLPQIISAVPTFPAGSEPLDNTMNFLTGMKYDTVKDEWYPEWLKKDAAGVWHIKAGKQETAAQAAERTELSRRYLAAMTPLDVINMKTDAFNSCILRFALNHGYDMNQPKDSATNTAAMNAAIADFRSIYEKNDVIKRLKAADPSVLAPMKNSVRKALGIDYPAPSP